jgi:carboxylate-amine ligase
MYSFGMEEEYFLFDAKTRHSVRRANKRFLLRAQKQLGDHVMTEMLQSQIEVATPPCDSPQEARGHLAHYRRTLGQPNTGLASPLWAPSPSLTGPSRW